MHGIQIFAAIYAFATNCQAEQVYVVIGKASGQMCRAKAKKSRKF